MSSVDPGLVAAGIMIPMFIDLLAIVAMTCCIRNRVDILLSNCSVVADHKAAFSGLGFIGDVVRIGVVATIFLAPGVYLKRGVIDEAQIRIFPKRYKMLIVLPWVVSVIVLSALVGFRVWIYTAGIPPVSK